MYKVRFYKGEYSERQRKANGDDSVCYVEHHFNSFHDPAAGYALVVTGSNASATSKNWGCWYAQAIAREFSVPVGGDDGIKVGGFNGRGDANLKLTTMPAVLLEPLFVSNPRHAEWVRSGSGQSRLARVLVESIQRFFPSGGLVAFSVGHKYKTSRPNDRGAAVAGGGTEADFAEKVLRKAKVLLEGVTEITEGREIRVMKNEELAWSGAIDADAEVTWDGSRGLLQIREP